MRVGYGGWHNIVPLYLHRSFVGSWMYTWSPIDGTNRGRQVGGEEWFWELTLLPFVHIRRWYTADRIGKIFDAKNKQWFCSALQADFTEGGYDGYIKPNDHEEQRAVNKKGETVRGGGREGITTIHTGRHHE